MEREERAGSFGMVRNNGIAVRRGWNRSPRPFVRVVIGALMAGLIASVMIGTALADSAERTTAEGLYSRSFGDSTNPAVIFLHGGPGYNSANFELTTSEALAERGYFVVVYDQRGCARSKGTSGDQFTREEAIADLRGVYRAHGIGRATLLGHSWGGTLAGFFADAHPNMVERVVLVGSPLSYQWTLRTILRRCSEIYRQRGDTANLSYMQQISAMDTASLPYSSYLFMHALTCGLYTPSVQTAEAKALYKKLAANPNAGLIRHSETKPVEGLFREEAYTTLDMTGVFQSCLRKGVPIEGIYGTEDGLFDEEHIRRLNVLLGDDSMTLIPGASHNVFIDRQTYFLDALDTYMQRT